MESKIRYESMDQLRGFAIFSMILVNVLNRFTGMEILRHCCDNFPADSGFSFADFVAPLFVFVVGMGFRISFLRTMASRGYGFAVKKSVWRFLVLFLIGVFVYHFKLRRILGDALGEIALSGLLTLPFIAKSAGWRIWAAFSYLAIFQSTAPQTYFGVQPEPLVWVFFMLMGTLAADWLGIARMADENAKLMRNWRETNWVEIIMRAVGWGVILSFLGLFLADVYAWPIAQRGDMHATYGLLYAGLSFFCFLIFYLSVDIGKMSLPFLSTLGKNALVVYILHYYIDDDLRKLIPNDAGVGIALLSFGVIFFVCYAVAKYLENRNYYVKI